MIAEIIAVGSEMLTPFRQDTNSLFLTEHLNNLGVSVAFKTIVGDSLAHLTEAANIALQRADLVLFSGGLGPTEDDLTREALAAALGLGMHRDPDVLADLRRRFAERNIPMPPNNLKQADILDTAQRLPNPNGTAPGQILTATIGGRPRIAILLPGPPRELTSMFLAECVPRLARLLPTAHLARRTLRMALIPESEVDLRTAPIYTRYPDVETTILSGSGEIQLHLVSTKSTAAEAQARVDQLATELQSEMGAAIFSAHNQSLPEVVLSLLAAQNLTLAAAESCTGGLLSERLTAIPDSSQVFHGGAIVYTPQLKTAFADVPADLIEQHGAVSDEVARALARGIRLRCQTTHGIAITGIAGPGHPSPHPSTPSPAPGPDQTKPIGRVHIALSTEHQTQTRELNLSGDRDRVRLWATQHASTSSAKPSSPDPPSTSNQHHPSPTIGHTRRDFSSPAPIPPAPKTELLCASRPTERASS